MKKKNSKHFGKLFLKTFVLLLFFGENALLVPTFWGDLDLVPKLISLLD